MTIFRGNNAHVFKIAPPADGPDRCPHERRIDEIEFRIASLERYAANANRLLWLIVTTALSTLALVVTNMLTQ